MFYIQSMFGSVYCQQGVWCHPESRERHHALRFVSEDDARHYLDDPNREKVLPVEIIFIEDRE